MALSMLQKLALGLVPGVADQVNQRHVANGNMAWNGLCVGVITARNMVYFAVAMSVLGAAVVGCATSAATFSFGVSLCVGGLLCTSIAAYALYQKVAEFNHYHGILD